MITSDELAAVYRERAARLFAEADALAPATRLTKAERDALTDDDMEVRKQAGSLRLRAAKAARKADALATGESFPVEFFRERALTLVARHDDTWSTLAFRAGLHKNGQADTTHLKRVLGMMDRPGRVGYARSMSDTVSREVALRLAEAFGVDLVDLEDPDPILTRRPRFQVFERSPECGFKDCAEARLPALGSGLMCQEHHDRLAPIRRYIEAEPLAHSTLHSAAERAEARAVLAETMAA